MKIKIKFWVLAFLCLKIRIFISSIQVFFCWRLVWFLSFKIIVYYFGAIFNFIIIIWFFCLGEVQEQALATGRWNRSVSVPWSPWGHTDSHILSSHASRKGICCYSCGFLVISAALSTVLLLVLKNPLHTWLLVGTILTKWRNISNSL